MRCKARKPFTPYWRAYKLASKQCEGSKLSCVFPDGRSRCSIIPMKLRGRDAIEQVHVNSRIGAIASKGHLSSTSRRSTKMDISGRNTLCELGLGVARGSSVSFMAKPRTRRNDPAYRRRRPMRCAHSCSNCSNRHGTPKSISIFPIRSSPRFAEHTHISESVDRSRLRMHSAARKASTILPGSRAHKGKATKHVRMLGTLKFILRRSSPMYRHLNYVPLSLRFCHLRWCGAIALATRRLTIQP